MISAYAKNCSCRKPKIGLIEHLTDVDFVNSVMIGDKYTDYLFSKNAGIPFMYMRSSTYFNNHQIVEMEKAGALGVSSVFHGFTSYTNKHFLTI